MAKTRAAAEKAGKEPAGKGEQEKGQGFCDGRGRGHQESGGRVQVGQEPGREREFGGVVWGISGALSQDLATEGLEIGRNLVFRAGRTLGSLSRDLW